MSVALLLLSAVYDVEFGSGFRSPVSTCSLKAKSFSCCSLMDIFHNLVSREEKTITFRLLLSSVSVSEGRPCAAALSAGLARDASNWCLVVGPQQFSALSRTEVEPEDQVEIWGGPWSKKRWLGPHMEGREKEAGSGVLGWVTCKNLFLVECSSIMGEWTRAQNHGVTQMSPSQCCQQGSLLGLWSV